VAAGEVVVGVRLEALVELGAEGGLLLGQLVGLVVARRLAVSWMLVEKRTLTSLMWSKANERPPSLSM
jgi:hypothetical protein